MIFLNYLQNLSQLSLFAIVEKATQDTVVKVDEDGLVCINQLRFDIKCIHSISFNPLGVYRLSLQLIEDKYHLNYFIKSNCFIKNTSIKNDANLPASSEILNDWIFCHHHHDGTNVFGQPQTSKDHLNRCKLITLDQIAAIVKSESIGSQLLFESTNQKESLLVKVINPCCLVGFKKELEKLTVNEINLESASHLEYQLLNIDENLEILKDARYRFDVVWFLVDNQTFECLYQNLSRSNQEEVKPFKFINPSDKLCAYLR